MKLPQRALQSGVQPLAGPDYTRPLKLGQAIGQVAMQAGEAIDAYVTAEDELKLQEKINAFNSEYSTVSAQLNNKQTYNLNNEELFSSGIRDQILAAEDIDQNIVDSEGRLMIPAYKVNQYVHDEYLTNRLPDFYEGLNKNDRIRFDKAVGKTTGKVTQELIKTGFQQRQLINSARFSTLIDDSKNAYDKDRTLEVIQAAYAAGAMNPADYQKELATYEGDIENLVAQNLVMSKDPNKIAQASSFAASGYTKMTQEQRWEIFTKAEQQEKKIIAAYDKDKKEGSKKTLSQVTLDIVATNEPLSWDDFKAISLGMTPEDKLTLIKTNAMVQQKSLSESDPFALAEIESLIAGLALPSSGLSIDSKRKALVNKLAVMTGIDPATGDTIEGGVMATITGADSVRLSALINSAQETTYKNPDLEINIKQGWRMLTGGSKESIVQLEGSSPSVLNAIQFERDFLKASREPNFKANDWFNKNVVHYETVRVKDNRATLIDSQLEVYEVRDRQGKIDWTTSLKNLKKARKEGMPDSVFFPMMKVVEDRRKNEPFYIKEKEAREKRMNADA